MALNLLMKFGHGNLNFSSVEKVLIKENEKMESLALKHMDKASDILTCVDTEMQKQAVMMQKLYLNANEEERSMLKKLWKDNYYKTICNILHYIYDFDDYGEETLAKIALSMAKIRVDIDAMINGSDLYNEYNRAENMVQTGKYKDAVKIAKKIYETTDESLFGITHEKEKSKEEQIALVGAFIIFVAIIAVLVKKPKK